MPSRYSSSKDDVWKVSSMDAMSSANLWSAPLSSLSSTNPMYPTAAESITTPQMHMHTLERVNSIICGPPHQAHHRISPRTHPTRPFRTV